MAICCSSKSLRSSCSLGTAGDMHIDMSNNTITLKQKKYNEVLTRPVAQLSFLHQNHQSCGDVFNRQRNQQRIIMHMYTTIVVVSVSVEVFLLNSLKLNERAKRAQCKRKPIRTKRRKRVQKTDVL